MWHEHRRFPNWPVNHFFVAHHVLDVSESASARGFLVGVISRRVRAGIVWLAHVS